MKRAAVVAVVGLGLWALAISVGSRGRKTGTNYGPAGGVTAEKPGDRRFSNEAIRQAAASIVDWPQASRRAAERMLEKYGVPDQADSRRLAWNDNGPWKRTVVRRDGGRDPLEQTAAYRVPNARYGALRHLPGKVTAERGHDELSSRAVTEPLNFLAVNLADEVVSGKRDADDARRFFEKTASLASSGKSSSYMEGLLFETQEKR
jgi:hypothetical protein